MERGKKGQAAMEFLMTYGWAILAAIIVIAVLAIYFNPSSIVSTQTIIGTPFYSIGTTLSTTQVQVEIKNNGGVDVTISDATLTFSQPSGATCTVLDAGSGILTSGSSVILDFGSATPCTDLNSGDIVSADLVVTYTKPESTLLLSSTGTVSGKVA